MNDSIEKRQVKYKELILEQLKKTPIVQIACEKTGISRATYYRWKKEDLNFSRLADEAITEGCSLINDMAESQLISTIKDKNLGAIIFWLKSHHPAYTTKMEVTAQLKSIEEKLTPEQEEIVTKALKLASLIQTVEQTHKKQK